MHVRLALCAAAAAMLFTAPGCADAFGARYREDVHTRVNTVPAALKVSDAVGEVSVLAWNKRYVEIDAVKRAGSADAVHEMKVTVTPSGNVLNVGTDFGSGTSNRSIDLTIHLPATTDVGVDASTGKVIVNGFTGNVNVSASVGKVEITMAALRRGQQLTVDSSVGAIDVTLPHDADATIDAQTSVGSIKGSAPLTVDRTNVGATAHGTIGSGGARVSITASTGSIAIDRE